MILVVRLAQPVHLLIGYAIGRLGPDGQPLDGIDADDSEDDHRCARACKPHSRMPSVSPTTHVYSGGDDALPGAKRAPDGSSRLATRPEVRSSCVRFSPTGREWAAATPQVSLSIRHQDC